MVNHYPHCRVTFLETPVYSIYEHSKYKGQTDSEFKKLDNELLSQINELSQNSREINTGLNNIRQNKHLEINIIITYSRKDSTQV